jgi:hypothetical protein
VHEKSVYQQITHGDVTVGCHKKSFQLLGTRKAHVIHNTKDTESRSVTKETIDHTADRGPWARLGGSVRAARLPGAGGCGIAIHSDKQPRQVHPFIVSAVFEVPQGRSVLFTSDTQNKFLCYIRTNIPLTLYTRRCSRGISDIPPRHWRFTKIS